jgi:hypothetical protein
VMPLIRVTRELLAQDCSEKQSEQDDKEKVTPVNQSPPLTLACVQSDDRTKHFQDE